MGSLATSAFGLATGAHIQTLQIVNERMPRTCGRRRTKAIINWCLRWRGHCASFVRVVPGVGPMLAQAYKLIASRSPNVSKVAYGNNLSRSALMYCPFGTFGCLQVLLGGSYRYVSAAAASTLPSTSNLVRSR